MPSRGEGLEAGHVVRARSRAPRSASSATRNGRPTEATAGRMRPRDDVVRRQRHGRGDRRPDRPSCRARGARARRARTRSRRRRCLSIRIGTRPAFSSNVTVERRGRAARARPRRARAKAVPTLGWPANGTSVVGVKMRTRRVWPASAGRTKVLSEKLNSRATCCICRSDRPRASGSTASGIAAEEPVGEDVAEKVAVAHGRLSRAGRSRTGRRSSRASTISRIDRRAVERLDHVVEGEARRARPPSAPPSRRPSCR